MRAEHTTRGGSTRNFTSGNYTITTQPKKEWSYVVDDENGQKVKCPDMGHKREIKPIKQLMEKSLAKKAGLIDEEMIAVVLYTGLFEHHCPFCRCCGVIAEFYDDASGQVPCLSSTIPFSVDTHQKSTMLTKPPAICSPPPFSFS